MSTSPTLSPQQVLEQGLEFVDIDWRGRSTNANKATFKAHYGRTEEVLSAVWFDIVHLHPSWLDLEDLEGNFRSFMKANFLVWAYPKNAEIFGAHFGGDNEKYCRGDAVWYWIELMAHMSREMFQWDEQYASDPNGSPFAWSADGVEFSAWEPKHPTMNKDRKFFSYKHNRAGFLYLFVMEVQRTRLAMIIGPVEASQDEIGLFRAHLKDKIPRGKYVIVDKGMKSGSDETERDLLAFPNPTDSQELKKFKARVRCRQEAFHSRLRKYAALEQVFRHGMHKHKLVVEAVCLLVQYDLDLGSDIFDG